MGSMLFIIVILGSAFTIEKSNCLKLLVLKEENSTIWEDSGGKGDWDAEVISLDRENPGESLQKVCTALGSSGAWLTLDLTWSGWEDVATLEGLRYLRADLSIAPLLRAAEAASLKMRNSTDAVLIFQHNRHLEQSLWYLVRESNLRVAVLEGLDEESSARLLDMRPSPSSYIIFADTSTANRILQTAVESKLVTVDDRWTVVFLDLDFERLNSKLLLKKTMTMAFSTRQCCRQDEPLPCSCPQPFDLERAGLDQLKALLDDVRADSVKRGLPDSDVVYSCGNSDVGNSTDLTTLSESFIKEAGKSWALVMENSTSQYPRLSLKAELEISVKVGPSTVELGRWDTGSGLRPVSVLPRVKRFFRIATGYYMPFAFNSTTKTQEDGSPVVEGYAVDLIDKLAQLMEFEYELVVSNDFGHKDENGTWHGLVGLLATGRVDMIVGALTMTSEREEVIDFVAPYFEQTGFSIIIRKPVKTTSLFKFMTVLKVEVWLSILGALCLTAIMIWLLDKYSPYSARNNKEKYPYPCRDFTLRESFWFAVTSFTPQGGGEAPKSLSARTLVAAYWLFVVLMLATFTANLAAFLTVERMQSPVQSLKHLARQSRINYTVVRNSDAYAHFKNMKNAEEILYRKWKEITLNSSTDQAQYRVWDYPIKEQYGHILMAIEKAGPVENIQEGLRKVEESKDAEYALIHEHLELKYYVYNNCNLTQIGEPFAEQPYAIAVQQGSHLNEEISRRILDLQRERFFETASSKYWNSTIKAKCDSVDEDEGITLESLGGVFIATLVGLFLAMMTLGVEVWFHKKKVKGKINTKGEKKQPHFIKDEIFTTKEFSHHNMLNKKATLVNTKLKPKVNQIQVFPRGHLY
nr:ionotropic receptor 8a [Tropidothorax elegans]